MEKGIRIISIMQLPFSTSLRFVGLNAKRKLKAEFIKIGVLLLKI